ncbi:MAG: polysaccharide deacetylase family protein, partial [Pseudomonadota bacterium]
MSELTFTLDLEDHRPRDGKGGREDRYPKRYPDNARKLLDFCTQNDIRGTIFTTGEVAQDDPALVRAFADAGHEIACHSLDHTHLDKQTPEAFRDHTSRAK